MISTAAFDRLMHLGRQPGGLKIDDIRQALPIDTMAIEEIADVVARLEEAGISVEVDAGLLTSRPRKRTSPAAKPTAELLPHSEQAATDHARLLNLASSIKAARENSRRTRGPAHTYVQKPGAIFVITAVSILILFTLVVWSFA